MKRGVVLLEPDAYGELQTKCVDADIAMARCPCCKGRFRVLPCDVLARKLYSIEVIEHALAAYALDLRSLRQVVWGMLGQRSPCHTTLFAWSEGLGAHALGLGMGEVPGGTPVSRLLAESESRVRSIGALLRQEYRVDPRRWRSPQRRERLSALKRILAVAELVTKLRSPKSFVRWRELALFWSNTCALLFRTGISCTAAEHRDRSDSPRSRAPPRESTDP